MTSTGPCTRDGSQHMRFVVSEYGAPLWQEASDMVLKVYAELFGASIHGHTDAFIVAQNEETGMVGACVGVNYGRGKPYFVEYYLPVPAEEVVSIHTGVAVPRKRIIELGPIVSTEGGAGREAMKALPYFAEEQGTFCGLFTATRDLKVILQYMRFPFEPLAEARLDALPPDERAGSGTYYDTQPITGLIRTDRIKSALGIEGEPGPVFEYEEAAGRAVA